VLKWPDIGHLAKWSVSSFKFGFGPECLQDQDPDTFWQSVPSPGFPNSNSPPQLTLGFLSALMAPSRISSPSSFRERWQFRYY
jgi:anaphase-promoting complex subunit 10